MNDNIDNESTNGHLVINEYLKLMPYVAPIREIINIDENDLFYMRFFIISYIFATFLSLSLLFSLNNWHIIVYYYEQFNSNHDKHGHNYGLLRTLSVLNYTNTKANERVQLDHLEKLFHENSGFINNNENLGLGNLKDEKDDLVYIPISNTSFYKEQLQMPFKTSRNRMYGDFLAITDNMSDQYLSEKMSSLKSFL
jgi:hypothetical protein